MPRIVQWERQIGRRLQLRDLFVFFAVVKNGSMARAATELGVSTPSVSEIIADLEHALGTRLLDRSSRGVAITPYGEALLRRGAAAFDELRQGINEIEALSDPTAGELNIGCPESIATILPPLIESFRRQCPRSSLGIDYEIATTFASRLRDRSLDLVLMRLRGRSLPDDPSTADLNVELLFDDELVVVAGAQSKWARRRQIDLTDLQAADWILPGPESWGYRILSEACGVHGSGVPPIRVRSLSGHLQANLLAEGEFVTLIARSVLHFYRKRFGLHMLPIKLPTPPWPVVIVTLKNRTLSPVAERFIQCVRHAAAMMAGGNARAAPRPTAPAQPPVRSAPIRRSRRPRSDSDC